MEIVVELSTLFRLLALLGLLFLDDKLCVLKGVYKPEIVVYLILGEQVRILKLRQLIFNLLEGSTKSLRFKRDALSIVVDLLDVLNLFLFCLGVSLLYLLTNLFAFFLLLVG
jgi:hypothetical protein